MKQFRYTLYMGSKTHVSIWKTYKPAAFLAMCEAFAENGAMFMIEFRTI
jgi:hypothetical protein